MAERLSELVAPWWLHGILIVVCLLAVVGIWSGIRRSKEAKAKRLAERRGLLMKAIEGDDEAVKHLTRKWVDYFSFDRARAFAEGDQELEALFEEHWPLLADQRERLRVTDKAASHYEAWRLAEQTEPATAWKVLARLVGTLLYFDDADTRQKVLDPYGLAFATLCQQFSAFLLEKAAVLYGGIKDEASARAYAEFMREVHDNTWHHDRLPQGAQWITLPEWSGDWNAIVDKYYPWPFIDDYRDICEATCSKREFVLLARNAVVQRNPVLAKRVLARINGRRYAADYTNPVKDGRKMIGDSFFRDLHVIVGTSSKN